MMNEIKNLAHATVIRSLMVAMHESVVYSSTRAASIWLRRRFPRSRFVEVISYHVGEAMARIDVKSNHRYHIVTLLHGEKLAVRMEDWMWRSQMFTGCWEPETTDFIQSWLNPGDIFIDIGANNGYFSCVAARCVGATGKVYSFEPAPLPYKLLNTSVKLNVFEDRVIVSKLAIGDKNRSSSLLHLPEDANDHGRSSLTRHNWLGNGPHVRVPVSTIDRFIERVPLERVRLVKLDIEGGELAALRGGTRFLRQVRPEAIICEVWAEDFSPGTASAVIAELRQFKYAPWRFSTGGTLVAFDGRLRPGATENLCFLPEDAC